MKDKTLRTYLIWAFGLAWPLQLLASRLALRGNMTGFTYVLAISMFAPLAALLLAKVPLKSLGWKLNLRGKVLWYLAAWFLPSVICVLGAALYYLLFPAHFDGTGAAYLASLPAEAQQQLAAQGLPTPLLLLLSALAAVTYAPLINIIPCLGEEAGWRGFLTPYLKARCGRTKGLLLAGLIWGVWHWPVMILAGYNYGTQYWGAPVTGPLLFCLVTFCLGVLFDWLYEKTRCIWIPALAHGAFNAVAGLPSLFLSVEAAPSALSGSASIDTAPSTLLGPTMIGLIAGLPMFLLAFLLWRKSDAQAA